MIAGAEWAALLGCRGALWGKLGRTIHSHITRPLVRQAARNKLAAILQVLITKDLMRGDALYAPALGVMRSLILAPTKNNPPAKAPLLLLEDPLLELDMQNRQLALIWMMAG